jgi:ABC-2 type transport system permease protein
MRRITLIARREFVAYASVPSFWIALAMGPVLMVLAAIGLSAAGAHAAAPHPQTIAIEAADPALRLAAAGAVQEAGRLEHHPVAIAAASESHADTTLDLTRATDGALSIQVRGQRLSDVSLALLRRDLAGPASVGEGAAAAVAVTQPADPPKPPADNARFARFAMTALLWLVLVGSLGMLLQAVVRERSNRALESLLASVRPSDLVIGKLAGVGALSAVVVGTWLFGGAVVSGSPLFGHADAVGVLFKGFASLPYVATAVGLFMLTFAMYGTALIGVGALARDVPAAQNFSRPVFGLLLLVFFVALAQFAGMGDGSLRTLVLFPPFTPFVLLLARPGTLDPLNVGIGLTGMLAVTATAAWLGAHALRGEFRLAWPRRAAAA